MRYQDDPDWWHERVFRLVNNRKQMGGTDGPMAISTMRLSERRWCPLDNSGRYPDGVVQVVSLVDSLAMRCGNA